MAADDTAAPMTTIAVQREGAGEPMAFTVTVRDAEGQSLYSVTMAQTSFAALNPGARSPEQIVDAAFRFLLDREPKESILARFDVTVISRYFPEFARELPRYLETAR